MCLFRVSYQNIAHSYVEALAELNNSKHTTHKVLYTVVLGQLLRALAFALIPFNPTDLQCIFQSNELYCTNALIHCKALTVPAYCTTLPCLLHLLYNYPAYCTTPLLSSGSVSSIVALRGPTLPRSRAF